MRACAAAVLVLFTSCRPGGPAPAAFFAAAPEPAAALDSTEIYPRGRRMPLTLYSLGPADVAQSRAAGFTMVGPYYDGGNSAAIADSAFRAGLRFAYQFHLPDYDFVAEKTIRVDAAELRAEVRAQMADVYADPRLDSAVAYWSVSPEELRPWRPLEMEYLDVFTRAVREMEVAHGRQPRPLWIYSPGNRSVEDLMAIGRRTDLLVVGAYHNVSEPDPYRIARAVDHAVAASRALPHRPPPIVVLWMADDPTRDTDRTPEVIRRTVRHDAYLALIRGARGLFVFSGYRRPGFHAFDLFLDGYASVVRELTGELHLAEVFLFGERRDDIAVEARDGPVRVSAASIAYSGARYLFVTSSGVDSVTVRVRGAPLRTRWECLVGRAPPPDAVRRSARLGPLDVAVWRLTPVWE